MVCLGGLSAGRVMAQLQPGLWSGHQRLDDIASHPTDPSPPDLGDPELPLAWWNVLLLVNANSPAGLEVVKLYREFHPEILDEQIVYLGGLTDSASLTAGPASEILTRADYEAYIAEPTRAHLRAFGLQDQVYVIITTAGMPYRIEDTDPALADVVKPNGSNGQLTVSRRNVVNAASVESELATLFLTDPAAPAASRMPIDGRVINPYHGYRSSIKRWAESRAVLARREQFRWTYMWRVNLSPKIEGDYDSRGYSALNRRMSPADLYLTARLDGPRAQGTYPVFAVRRMLARAAQVSDPFDPAFVGYNAGASALVIDHSPRPPAPAVYADTDVYNIPYGTANLSYVDHPVPPCGAEFTTINAANHYFTLFAQLTGSSATVGGTGSAAASFGLGGRVLWDDSGAVLHTGFLNVGEGAVGLLTYGRNGGDGRPANYLLTAGPGGGPLLRCVPGAVFTSLESFNGVTFFTNITTWQEKIADFIAMGGTAAAGHAFEPEVAAALQGEFLYTNLLRDDNGDGVGDLTLVEAVFTGLPYVSWAELLIGDPLMRLRSGPGSLVDLNAYPGDVDGDGVVAYADVLAVLDAFGGTLGGARYDVRADGNEDGVVGDADLEIVLGHFGAQY